MREHRRSADELKPLILRAHAAGDARELARLQSEYRQGGLIERLSPLKPCLVEPAPKLTDDASSVSTQDTAELPELRLRDREDEIPELLSDAEPRLVVRLGHGALEAIHAELSRSEGLLDTVESGGNLIGEFRGGELHVLDATGPGEDGKARRFPDAARISTQSGYGVAGDLQKIWDNGLITFIGGWHTHPRPVREPSEADRQSALAGLDELVRKYGWKAPNQWLDLILFADSREGWASPKVAGWATRRPDWGGAVTEPVRVEEGS